MRYRALLASIIVLILCMALGAWIASCKPLWLDEYYTAVSSIEGRTYAQQWMGRVPEGNNPPLFYVLQKAFLQLVDYKTPESWRTSQRKSTRYDQIVLRTVSIVCMSLSIMAVFYYCTQAYSLWAGLYSLFIYASSYMLWIYWAEARPYALMILLMTLQMTVFLKALKDKEAFRSRWKLLAFIHLLMGLTFFFSVGPVLAVSSLLWFKGNRDLRKYLLLTLVPVLLSVYFSSIAPKFPFYFGLTPEQLIRDNISRDRIYILGIFLLFLVFYAVQRKIPAMKGWVSSELLKPLYLFLFALMMFFFTIALMIVFGLNAGTPGQAAPIVSRHFIYLMPVGVMSTVLLSCAILRSLSAWPWARLAMGVGIACLVIPRFIKIVPKAVLSFLGA